MRPPSAVFVARVRDEKRNNMTNQYPRECIEVVALEGITPIKLHEILMLSSNPLDISNQLKSLNVFKNNSDAYEEELQYEELWYKVNDTEAVKSRAEHTVSTFKHQLPLATETPDERYPYHELPVAVHDSVWDFYKAVGYDYKVQRFVGIGNIK